MLFLCAGQLLNNDRLSGLRLRPSLSYATTLKHSQPLGRPDLDDSDDAAKKKQFTPNTGPLLHGIDPNHCTAEWVDDVSVLLARRLMTIANQGEIDVPFADLAIEELVKDYVVDLDVFSMTKFHALNQPINCEVLIMVLEILNPVYTPIPTMIKMANSVGAVPDIKLRLWRHSYLDISLCNTSGTEGLFGRSTSLRSGTDTQVQPMPLGLEMLSHLFAHAGGYLASHWEPRYNGAGQARYGRSAWTLWEWRNLAGVYYDGWAWMLAIVHWAVRWIYTAQSDLEYHTSILFFRHVLAALRIPLTYKKNPVDVDLDLFDCANIGFRSCNDWTFPVPAEPLNVNSVGDLFASLESCQVIKFARSEAASSAAAGNPEVVAERKDRMKYGIAHWQNLAHLIFLGTERYLSDKKFL